MNYKISKTPCLFFRAYKSRLPIPVTIGFIALYIVILFALTYIAYDTYKHSHKRDARFLLSFQIILAAYVLSPFIVVPSGRSTIPLFIKNKYLLMREPRTYWQRYFMFLMY